MKKKLIIGSFEHAPKRKLVPSRKIEIQVCKKVPVITVKFLERRTRGSTLSWSSLTFNIIN